MELYFLCSAFTGRLYRGKFMVRVVYTTTPLFAATFPALCIFFHYWLRCRLTVRAQSLKPGHVVMRPAFGIRGGAVFVYPWATPAAMRPPALDAAGHEVSRMREIGADEADLDFSGGPETGGDVCIWRALVDVSNA